MCATVSLMPRQSSPESFHEPFPKADSPPADPRHPWGQCRCKSCYITFA